MCIRDSSKIPKGKKQLNILIDEKLYKMLVEIAPKVYGKGRGGISAIVEEALEWYLEHLLRTHTKTQTGTSISSVSSGAVRNPNPPLSIREEFNKFIETLKDVMEENTGVRKVPIMITVRLARAVMLRAFKRCKDERTQNRKLHNWYLVGFIKPYKNGKPVRISRPSDWYGIEEIEIVARGGA